MLADFDHLRQLPVAEKLALIDLLWQDIEGLVAGDESGSAALEEIQRRADEAAADPSSTMSREQVWRTVDARRG